MSIWVQSWWSLVSGILPICTQSRENAIESVWLQLVAQRALAFLHIDSSRIYHRSSCRTPTMTVETSWSSSLRSKYVSCLHRRSCLVYAHQEEWALITCSLVPRPHPVFQCCTLKNVFQRATLKNWVTCTKSCIVCEVWDGPPRMRSAFAHAR